MLSHINIFPTEVALLITAQISRVIFWLESSHDGDTKEFICSLSLRYLAMNICNDDLCCLKPYAGGSGHFGGHGLNFSYEDRMHEFLLYPLIKRQSQFAVSAKNPATVCVRVCLKFHNTVKQNTPCI